MKNINIFIICKLPFLWLVDVRPNDDKKLMYLPPLYISISKTIGNETIFYYKEKFPDDNKKILIFDIDNTLYKYNKRLFEAEIEGHKRVLEKYKHLNTNACLLYENGVPIKLNKCYSTFNITPLQYETIKNVNYGNFIEGDYSLLADYLSRIKCRLWCFTNGLECRARAILQKLDIEKYFECVVVTDDHIKNPIKKPNLDAYKFVEKLIGLNNPENIYFFDDLEENVLAAIKMGWNAFLVEQDQDLVDLLKSIKILD